MSSSHSLLPRDAIPVFNGDDDAYGWVLDIDKYFAETGISSTSKLLIAAFGLQGPPLQWWLQWSHNHPMASWETFISPFLWHFKPEWQHLLPTPEEPTEVAYDLSSTPPPSIISAPVTELVPPFVDEPLNMEPPTFRKEQQSCLSSPILDPVLEFLSSPGTNSVMHSFTVSDPDSVSDDSLSAKHGSLSLSPILKEEWSPLTEDLTAERFVPPLQHLDHDVMVNPPLPQTPPKPPDRHCRVVIDAPDPSFASDDSTMPPPPAAPPDQQWHTMEEDDVLCVSPTDQYSSETKLQLINDHRTMPPRPPQPPNLQPLAFSAENDVVHLLLLDSQCRCLLDVRRNNPTKSPPPKPPDRNYNEVSSLLSEPPDLCCCSVAPMSCKVEHT